MNYRPNGNFYKQTPPHWNFTKSLPPHWNFEILCGRASSLSFPYHLLPSCQKSKRSYDRFLRKTPNTRADGAQSIGPTSKFSEIVEWGAPRSLVSVPFYTPTRIFSLKLGLGCTPPEILLTGVHPNENLDPRRGSEGGCLTM